MKETVGRPDITALKIDLRDRCIVDGNRRYQAIYFVFFASYSGLTVFRNVYLKEIGMTGVQMGMIGSLWVAGGIVAQPLWGLVADYTQSPIRILGIAAVLSAVAVLSYPLGASLPTGVFVVIALGTFLFSATRSPIRPIANSLVLRQGHDYGPVRSFGSIAFGGTVLLTGFALAWIDVSFVIYAYVAGMGVFLLLIRGLPPVEEQVFEGGLGSRAFELVRQPVFLVVLLGGFVMGMVGSSGGAFFSVYMRVVGLGDGLTGVAWGLKTVAEAIVFLSLVRLGLSYGRSVALGGLTYVLGFALMATFPSLAPVLLANLSLGSGVALLQFAFVNLAHECAPEALHSTAQTVLMSVGIGAGGMVGQTLAGWLVDAVGVQRMYIYLAGGAALLVLVGIVLQAVDPSGPTGTVEA